MDSPIIFNPRIHSDLIPSIVRVHAECITSPPYTVATFLPPLDDKLMIQYWEFCAKEISEGKREIIVQIAKNDINGEDEVAGVVMLEMRSDQTGPFRSEIQKLLVSPRHRNKGIARAMMEKLEEIAKERQSGLLRLDTTRGSPAELIYPKLGYIQIGILPGNEISPFDGSLKDTVLFYKDLR